MESRFSVSALTENDTNSLLRVTSCLSRHQLKIESFSCTNVESTDVYQHTWIVRATADRVRRAVKQIGACIGVLEVMYRRDEEMLGREVALFKLAVDATTIGDSLASVVRASRARILVAAAGYVVVEKTGSSQEIEEFFGSMEPYGVMEFVRSGRITVTKRRPELAPIEASTGANNGGSGAWQ